MRTRLPFVVQLSALIFLWAAIADAQLTNSWITMGGSFWDETPNWSLLIAPSNNQAAIFITNALTKTVTIDSFTANNRPGTMTISNLTVQGFGTGINTLQLANAGVGTPLRVINRFRINSGAALLVTNSALRVESVLGDDFLIDGSVTLRAGASVVATNAGLVTGLGNIGNGSLTMSGGSLSLNSLFIGNNAGISATMTIAGGTNTVSSVLDVGRNSNATGAVWVTGGRLVATNAATSIAFAGFGQMTISNGTVLSSNVFVSSSSGRSGTLTVAGGQHLIVGDSHLPNGGALEITTTGAVWVTGGQLVVTNGDAHIGRFGVGQMTLSNGTVLCSNVFVGSYASSQGTLSVAGGTNTVLGALEMGLFIHSTGTVWVTGGRLEVANGTFLGGVNGPHVGQMTVSNGTWLTRSVSVGGGEGSQGTLTVAGGTNINSSLLAIGINTNATGAVWVTGGRSVVTNDETDVGYEGLGQMTVSNGTVLCTNVFVGRFARSKGTLTVAGGTLAAVGPVTVGLLDATGTVKVTGGQLVITNRPDLVGAGSGFIVDGGVTLTNGSSIIVSNVNTIVGNRGAGSLTNFGGSVNLSSALILGAQVGSTGRVVMTGGQFSVTSGGVVIGSNGVGFVTQSGGTNKTVGALIVGFISTANGSLTVSGGQLVATNNNIIIGQGGPGQFTQSGGSVLMTNVTVGRDGGSRGTFSFSGGTNQIFGVLTAGQDAGSTGAVWVTGGRLIVTNDFSNIGNNGVGQLTVSNGIFLGSTVRVGENSGSRGTLTIAGGTNILRSTVNPLVVGDSPNATGNVWVTGGQLIGTNSTSFNSFIGNAGVGALSISNGEVRLSRLAIASGLGSQGTLTIAGGTNVITGTSISLSVGDNANATGRVWLTAGQLVVTNNSGTATIGNTGIGQMAVSNGTFFGRAVEVGRNVGSAGSLTVAGTGKGLIYSMLTLGNFACSVTGVVTVTGGELRVTNSSVTAVLEVRSGTLTHSGGTLEVDKLVVTNSCARFINTGGPFIFGAIEPLPAAFDADGDGLPNGFELAHGLDPFDPSGNNGPDADPDGDGQTTAEEMAADTDPFDSSSSFRITAVAREANNIRITWTAVSNKTYRVLASPGTVNGSFTNDFGNLSPLITMPGVVVGPTTNYLDVGAATNAPSRYYRVRLVP